MSTRLYAADQVKVTFGVLPLNGGFAAGTFLTETRNSPNWNYKYNGYADTVPMVNTNTSGRIVFQLNRESSQHAALVTLANTDLILRAIALPLVVRDSNSRMVTIYNKARPQGVPGLSAGTSASVVPWVFLFSQTFQQPFGFNANVAGS